MRRAIQIVCVTGCTFGSMAFAQPPDIQRIDVIPPAPTNFDVISIDVFGTLDIMSQTIADSPWRLQEQNVLIDLLMYWLPVGAPPVIEPFTDVTDVGQLPVATYDVTARIFVDLGLDPDPFPDPWTFPDTYEGQPPIDTMAASFTVIPEPVTLMLIAVGVPFLLKRSRR